jgi:hypothetical protein
MFDQDLDAERSLIRPSHLNKLILFLGGHDVGSGQLSFWPYDFKMIPVETISAIYQDFLSIEDREKQRKQGAQKCMQKVPKILQEGGTGCLLLPTKILQNQTDTFQAE